MGDRHLYRDATNTTVFFDERIIWKWMAWSLGRLLSFTSRGAFHFHVMCSSEWSWSRSNHGSEAVCSLQDPARSFSSTSSTRGGLLSFHLICLRNVGFVPGLGLGGPSLGSTHVRRIDPGPLESLGGHPLREARGRRVKTGRRHRKHGIPWDPFFSYPGQVGSFATLLLGDSSWWNVKLYFPDLSGKLRESVDVQNFKDSHNGLRSICGPRRNLPRSIEQELCMNNIYLRKNNEPGPSKGVSRGVH